MKNKGEMTETLGKTFKPSYFYSVTTTILLSTVHINCFTFLKSIIQNLIRLSHVSMFRITFKNDFDIQGVLAEPFDFNRIPSILLLVLTQVPFLGV